jgi:hypothetical protein
MRIIVEKIDVIERSLECAFGVNSGGLELVPTDRASTILV